MGRGGRYIRVVLALLVLASVVSQRGRATEASAQAPSIVGLTGPQSVERYARFETNAEAILPAPTNPFDPDEIDVQGHFRDPSGRVRHMPGFWYQGYTRELDNVGEQLTKSGPPVWKVRFAPDVAGAWTWWWTVRTSGGTTATAPTPLAVLPSDSHGYVRRSAIDPHYLAFDDGTSYFAVGENVSWANKQGTFDYDRWYAKLAEQGANYSRLWMPSWQFGIEWNDTPLGDYTNRLGRAWKLDHVIELGEELGIYHVVSLLYHGAFSATTNPQWKDNPYNAANGGPLAEPVDVFDDPVAKDLLKQRFRYIVARWGYSTHVLSWELWNEADLVDGYDPAKSLPWHREMAGYLRSIDPANHLVSTSYSLPLQDPLVWSSAGMDYHQFHFYSRTGTSTLFPNLSQDMNLWIPAAHAAYRLPVLFGEFGVGTLEVTRRDDPAGVGFHDGLWAAAMSGSFGTGMTWWWDEYIDKDPDRFYPMFGSIARFVEGVRWDRERFVRSPSIVLAGLRSVRVMGVQGPDRALLWLKNDKHQWNSPDREPVVNAKLVLAGLTTGTWCGSWWDTAAGAPRLAPLRFSWPLVQVLNVPAFVGDIALRLTHC